MGDTAIALLAFYAALLVGACGSGSTDSSDAAVNDARVSDAGMRDAAVHDARVSDAGARDAAISDARMPDGRVVDAAVPDARDDAEIRACEDEISELWRTAPPTTGLGSAAARMSYEQVIGQLMADFDVPGGAVAVTRNGKLVLALAIGLGDVDAEQPAHPDSLFRVASLSKQITAIAILRLVEQGALSLEQRAFDVLPPYQPLPGRTRNPALANITVRNLLQHTGGWNRSFEAVRDPMFRSGAISADFGIPGPADAELVIRWMLDKPLTYTPGTAYCYSNFGYNILGRIIERASGMGYEEYVEAAVLAPAGITDMAIGRSLLAGRADGEVRYYDYSEAPLVTAVFPDISSPIPRPYGGWYQESLDAHGGWIASPVDMLRLQVTIDGVAAPADQLTATSLAAMREHPHVAACTVTGGTVPESDSYWYGFGFRVNRWGNIWHMGALPGTATENVIAANGFSWAAFFNSQPADSSAFYSRLDRDLWTALQGVDTWEEDDLFDQYPAWSAWLPRDDFFTEAARHEIEGRYPSRIEGRNWDSGVEYRARFAPTHPGMDPVTAVGLDCLDYRARQAVEEATGRAVVSLQTFRDAESIRRYQVTWAR